MSKHVSSPRVNGNIASTKNRSGSASSSSSMKGSSQKLKANSSGVNHPCGSCQKPVTDEGIECETCLSWFHFNCSKFNKETVKSLSIPGMHWYCPTCDQISGLIQDKCLKSIESKLTLTLTDWQTKISLSESATENSLLALESKLDSALATNFSNPASYERLKDLDEKLDNTMAHLKSQLDTNHSNPASYERLKVLDEKLDSNMTHFKLQLAESADQIKKLNRYSSGLPDDQTNLGLLSDNLSMPLYSSAVKQNNQQGSSVCPVPSGTKPTVQGPPTKLRHNRVDFDPDKCVIVHSFDNKSLAINHVAIRHSISKLLDNPIIMFMKKFEHDKNEPKLMIQFEKTLSVDQLLEKWIPSVESCKLRRPQRPSPRSDGICFGVPINVSEDELLEHVKQSYPSCERVIRFVTKNKSATSTVKMIFKDMNELGQAIDNGIYIQKLCLKLNVEKARPPKPRPLQCYHCWGYGHLASKCSSEKVCRRCSDKITVEADHSDCSKPPKCGNCGSLDHDATNHSDCPLFNRILQKLTDREAIRNTQP